MPMWGAPRQMPAQAGRLEEDAVKPRGPRAATKLAARDMQRRTRGRRCY